MPRSRSVVRVSGIVVDEHCRTNIDGVYAAGDVANHLHPLVGHHIRVEHWQNAMKQGAAAAKAMLGSTEPYGEVHWFWSDQYDANIQSAGHVSDWVNPVIRGDLESRSFVAFYLRDGWIEGAAKAERQSLKRELAALKRME